MSGRATRALGFGGPAALVILLARTLAYSLSPSPAARVLEQRAGGPSLPMLTLVSLALGATVAIVICTLAALGVRERALVERRRLAAPRPSFDPTRAFVLALALAIATSLGGGLLEAYVHWRAGLGWHGLQCIVGPIHRDLLPLEAALSFVAAAVLAAAAHVVAWMRRTFSLLRALPPRAAVCAAVALPATEDLPPAIVRVGAGTPRAPPARS
jgi:hypothetical protein